MMPGSAADHAPLLLLLPCSCAKLLLLSAVMVVVLAVLLVAAGLDSRLLRSVVDLGVLPSALLLLTRGPSAAAVCVVLLGCCCCCWKHESSCTSVTPKAGFLHAAVNSQTGKKQLEQ
jgi:hypothetical protein